MTDNEKIPRKAGGLKNSVGIYVRCDWAFKHELIKAVIKSGLSGAEFIRQAVSEKIKKVLETF